VCSGTQPLTVLPSLFARNAGSGLKILELAL
jgi:hypothetical protein